MNQITNVNKLKADLAGTYAVQLSLVVEHLEAYAKNHHANDHGAAACITFGDCENPACDKARLIIQNSRRMIEQGV